MDFSQNEASPLRKFGGLGVVVLIHIIGAYALVTGLASRMIDSIKAPVETKVIEEKVKPPPPPPDPTPPPPKMTAPPPPFIPPPEVPVQQQVQNPIQQTTSVAPPAEKFRPAEPPKETKLPPGPAYQPQPGFADLNSCKPDYPRASLLAEEAGTVKVTFEVGADGQLVGSSITQSSGYKNLDRATVNALSRCKFKPAYKDGQPIQSSFQAVYVWKLPD
jgi:protein TonB